MKLKRILVILTKRNGVYLGGPIISILTVSVSRCTGNSAPRNCNRLRSEHVRPYRGSSQKPSTVGVSPRYEYEVAAGPPSVPPPVLGQSVVGQSVEP